MNPLITTLEPTPPAVTSQDVLKSDSYHGSILTLTPHGQISDETDAVNDRIYIVLDGTILVSTSGVNTYLNRDAALLVPKGKQHRLTAESDNPTRVLRLDIPPRQVTAPPIVTFGS